MSELEPNASVTVGGELRERFESTRNAGFGLSSPAHNDYLLHRASVFADLRRGDKLRGLVEVVAGFASGWKGSPPPTQDDPLDLLQAYAEPSIPLASGMLALRAGRQELSLGSSRLVSIRESPNIRRAFDGVRTTWTRGEGRSLDAFLVLPVSPEDGIFDDASAADRQFWGVYATRPAGRFLAIDAYYLGLDQADAVFAQGQARERRNTVGVRAFGERDAWDWNVEGAWQWGSFGDSSIRAWTISVDAGFELSNVRLSPRLGLKVDAISGDRDIHDGTLGTFNPLFPKLPYFSEANLATPANLFDVQPSVRLTLSDRVSFQRELQRVAQARRGRRVLRAAARTRRGDVDDANATHRFAGDLARRMADHDTARARGDLRPLRAPLRRAGGRRARGQFFRSLDTVGLLRSGDTKVSPNTFGECRESPAPALIRLRAGLVGQTRIETSISKEQG